MAQHALIDSDSTNPNANPPRVYIQVQKKDLAQMKGLKVGQPIEVRLTGKLILLTERQDVEFGREGELAVEGFRLKVRRQPENEFEVLSDGEEEPVANA